MNIVFVVLLFVAGFVISFLAVFFIVKKTFKPSTAGNKITTAITEAVCPWCGGKDYSTDPPFPCPEIDCRAVHHVSCWNKNGGCSVFDCAKAPKG